MKIFKITAIFIAIALLLPLEAKSQEQPRTQNPPTKTAPNLEQLTNRMKKNPDDLDAFYQYARMSSRAGKLKSAENAYLHMLKKNPRLDKIKTALAIIYLKMNRMPEAKKLLNEVLNNNPPPFVKKNIIQTLESLDARENKVQEAKEEAPEQKETKPNKSNDKEQLAALKAKADETPNNLDAYFSLAKLAEKMGDAQIAEEAYLHMIEKEPSLDRVKLDLGLLYVKTGKLTEAKSLFESVLEKNPPEKVKENINKVLKQVNNALKTDIISGSASFGVNSDSNANSAASTGETTFSDISIPLAANSVAKGDAQIFASASLSHLRKFDTKSKNWGATYNTTGTYYKTSQTTLHNLDISLVSLKTGPTFNLNNLKSQVSFLGGISVIELNSLKYMKTRSADITLKFAPTNKLIFDNIASYEYRNFINSPTSTNNTDRTGRALQDKLGITYMLTKKDILNSNITWRNELAKLDKYGLDQINFTLGYTRQLPYEAAFNAIAGFKRTNYDDLDTTISSTILRRDIEKTLTFTLAKKLPKNITATASYQYKNSNSNIQNYTYDNHRFSGAIGWSF